MERPFPHDKLVIATHNAGKLREFESLLRPYVSAVVSAGQLGLAEPEENGATFADNALIKALAAAKASGCVALADDSGLCVAALDGRPGLYSARWMGPEKDPRLAMRRVNEELGDAADRSAHFACVLALAWPDGYAELTEGRCDGVIVWPPRGDQGHDYDPIFQPRGSTMTFAEMDAGAKHALSQRGAAMRALVAKYFG